MKKSKKTLIMALASITVIAAVAGAWAYFVSTQKAEVSANAEQMNVKITKTNFVQHDNMVPGDTANYALRYENAGARDVNIMTEITLTSDEPFSDELAWFIYEKSLDPAVKTAPSTGSAAGGDLTFAAAQMGAIEYYKISADKKSATFVVNSGTLSGSISKSTNPALLSAADLEFVLAMSVGAGNEFQGKHCTVTADVFAVQTDYTEGVFWEVLKNSASPIGSTIVAA